MEAKDYLTAIRATGMTQAEVAARTGIPQPTISKIERGEVEDVMSRNYRALQALHRSVVRKAKPATQPA
jgi:transcriptional regulator with XRE-family HTH domain